VTRAKHPDGRFDQVQIPVGGGFWRALGGNGALVVGYVLVGIHLVLIVAGTTIGLGLEPEARAGLQRATLVSTAVLPLLATVFLWIGELVRRGHWGGPSGHKPDALLPQGSTTVRVRPLPVSWHVLWLVVAAGVALLLLTGLAREALDVSGAEQGVALWTVHGLLLAGVAGAVLGSLVKKLSWARRRARAGTPSHPALARRRAPDTAGRTFWRWFGFRWRLDLWCSALGAMALWSTGWVLVQRPAFPDDAASMAAVAVWLGLAGLVLLVGGLWATAQFWRTGEDLASAESVA